MLAVSILSNSMSLLRHIAKYTERHLTLVAIVSGNSD